MLKRGAVVIDTALRRRPRTRVSAADLDSFAVRLNRLFDTVYPPGRGPYCSRELVTALENRGLALSRRQLLDAGWGHDWYGDERTVDVHVRQLRRKLGDALPLATLRGTGYRLD